MNARPGPRLYTIPPGAPFLRTVARTLLEGELVPGFRYDGDPLALAGAVIYVPTRRAARELRGVFVEYLGGSAALLPTVRALGEVDDDEVVAEPVDGALLELAPPVAPLDRLLLLAPLVRAWKRHLPAHLAALHGEEVVIPVSTADAIWLARDLAALMDQIETEGGDLSRLGALVPDSLAGWWQLTLEFLEIVTAQWPRFLAERDRANPVAHRNDRTRAEARRLAARPPGGPVVAAGSTGSIPATAELLGVIARLPSGAVVLPGLDKMLDARSWSVVCAAAPHPAVLGHPQCMLARLLGRLEAGREDVVEIGAIAPARDSRRVLVGEAMRPAETSDAWAERVGAFPAAAVDAAFADVAVVEAPTERDEAVAIAIALREAIGEEGRTAALVTVDRGLARRVAAELARFGIRADDSGGAPLADTTPAGLLRTMVQAVFRPGDPLPILALLKHPLLRLGLERPAARHAAEVIELVALRGGVARPDIAGLRGLFDDRLRALRAAEHPPHWYRRFTADRFADADDLLSRLEAALKTLTGLRTAEGERVPAMATATAAALEALGAGPGGDLSALYEGESGAALAAFLRALVAAEEGLEFEAREWPEILDALIAGEMVKPAQGADPRIAIWGALEARLQEVDTLVIGGLNEGAWPRRPQADRFMSRTMKAGIALDPPERRIGLAAHDFVMAMGAEKVVLSRSLRAGDAPAVASRWLQRLMTFLGPDRAGALRGRGDRLVALARAIDDGAAAAPFQRPCHAPPVEARPRHFSVTEIETLRRDPYAVYARKVLSLRPLEPLLREPGAADRGTLFHDILHRFTAGPVAPDAPAALEALVDCGRAAFAAAALPADVAAVWWPRFLALAPSVIAWDGGRGAIAGRLPEARAQPTPVGAGGVTLSGSTDRIDLLSDGRADILDFKTGSTPSKKQAHALLAPQLALEGALLRRGAFAGIGAREPADLAYVRLRPNGRVEHESILRSADGDRTAPDLSEEAWERLQRLLEHYRDPANGYLSRALPFREGDTDGDYDHLARVLEWSAGAEQGDGGGGE